MSKDYRNGVILGFIIGIFLIPLLVNLGLTAKHPLLPYISIVALPILSVLGLAFTHLIFSKVPILWQFSKFGLIGVANTVINFGVFNLFVYISNLTSGPYVSLFSALAFCAALVNSYIWNSHWSFENKNPRTTEEFIVFFLVTFVGLAINTLIVTILVHSNPNATKLYDNFANLVATLVTMLWSFFGFKFIVFKEHKTA